MDSTQRIARGFPNALEKDVSLVWESITSHCPRPARDVFLSNFAKATAWQLIDGEHIHIPYRVYYTDTAAAWPAQFSLQQQTIYHCILSRSCDSYVREHHIKALLDMAPPHWALPYVIKVCDEYVVEILEAVYARLSGTDTSTYQALCRLNLQQFLYSHARMVSYWNEYYRWDCYRYRNYVGKALFETCFGYTRSMEPFREKHHEP